jgi:APA family basic amino acid/polyamine antiporter
VGSVSPRTGTPIVGLTITLIVALLLLISGEVSLALNIAVFALVVLYFLHSFALLVLPRANPELYASVTLRLPLFVQRLAALVSLVAMGALIVLQIGDDVAHGFGLIKLVLFWGVIGGVLYAIARSRRRLVSS